MSNDDISTLSIEERLTKDFQKLKELNLTAKYYKKHERILPYIEMLQVFTVNKIYQTMKGMNEKITRITITNYLDTLYNDGYLLLDLIPTKFGHYAQLYHTANCPFAKVENARYKLETINQKKEKKKEKTIDDKVDNQREYLIKQKKMAKELKDSEIIDPIEEKEKMQEKAEKKAVQKAFDRQAGWDLAKGLKNRRAEQNDISKQMEANKNHNEKMRLNPRKKSNNFLSLEEETNHSIIEETINDEGEVCSE